MIISFEGSDSSGKSTQAKILYDNMTKMGLKVKLFHFPRYESPIGNLIGKVLQGKHKISFDSLQMLYAADQKDFNEELNILIAKGYTILLDRYDLSTIAYYTAKKNIDLSTGIKTVTNWQKDFIKPDITFVFNIKNALERRDKSTFDILERDENLMKKINQVYLDLKFVLSNMTDRKFKVIDASLTKEEISSTIGDIINNL